MAICRECVLENAQKFYDLHQYPAYDIIQSCTVNDKNQHHSFGDKPSKTYTSYGGKDFVWHKDGVKHRDRGPAITYHNDPMANIYYYEGQVVVEVQKNLYVGKTWACIDESIMIIVEKINDVFYMVMSGDQKFLAVSLDKTQEA